MNIARLHRQRTLARRAAEAGADAPTSVAVEGEGGLANPGTPAENAARMMMVKLTADRARLKSIQSDALKAKAKMELLPEYDAWLDGLIEAKDSLPLGVSNDVLTTAMVWHIDAGNIARAIALGEAVIERAVPMPAWWKSTSPSVLAERVAEAAFAAIREGQDFETDHLSAVQLLTEDEDMPDEVRAKLYKAEAQLIEIAVDKLYVNGDAPDGVAGAAIGLIEMGLRSAATAQRFHAACGVKKLIDKLNRLKAKLEKPLTENKA
jgi:Phage small terminase subunit